MEVLKYYDIDENIFCWIKDFLSEREQEVRVEGISSGRYKVLSGVPQGSVLGPLLFILYINLLVDKTGDLDIFLYADDLKLFKVIKSYDDEKTLQKRIDIIYDWSKYSLINLHPDKCVSMRLRGNKLDCNKKCFYNLNEKLLKTVSQEKDLGVIIDDSLSFDTHIQKKVTKANALTGMIRRTFTHMDKDIFRTLFITIVRPHLEYGAPIWNPYKKGVINMIENVQRRATKQVPGLRDLPYMERLKLLNLPTLKYRRYRGDMITTYKLAHKMFDSLASKDILCFETNQRYHLRRHCLTIKKSTFNKDVRKNSFRNRVANQWNALPESIVTAPSINAFKNRLDKIWCVEMYDPDLNL